MKKTIFFKICFSYLFLICLLSILIFFFSFSLIRSHSLNLLVNNLQTVSKTLEHEVGLHLQEKSFDLLNTRIKELGKKLQKRITVIDLEGTVLADSEENSDEMENHRTRPEVLIALKGETGVALRYSTTLKEDMLYVAFPLHQNNKMSGISRVSIPTQDITLLLKDVKKAIFHSAAIIIFIAFLVAVIFARNLSLPIKRLRVAAESVASGNFDVQVTMPNKDEMGLLAESFNGMTKKINTLFSELSIREEELWTIINSVKDALIVLDHEGTILISNETFDSIADSDQIVGHFFWEAIHNTFFRELIEHVRNERKNVTEEIIYKEKVFLCSASYLPVKGTIIIILFDITDMKQLQQIKKDLLVNVSHEMRTPLTALKGFIETLEEEIDQKNGHYVDKLKKNTERLIAIVEDLLTLSEIESNKEALHTEEVRVQELLEEVAKIFEDRIKEKGLQLRMNLDPNVLPLFLDPFRIEQVIINLLDNAIKYTDKGTITVCLSQEDNQVLISVADTGIGIPQEHQERIFERFYVVDKSRSRQQGGTGLGLSIVKHIVLLHKGVLEVESNPGSGTICRIRLPFSA